MEGFLLLGEGVDAVDVLKRVLVADVFEVESDVLTF